MWYRHLKENTNTICCHKKIKVESNKTRYRLQLLKHTHTNKRGGREGGKEKGGKEWERKRRRKESERAELLVYSKHQSLEHRPIKCLCWIQLLDKSKRNSSWPSCGSFTSCDPSLTSSVSKGMQSLIKSVLDGLRNETQWLRFWEPQVFHSA